MSERKLRDIEANYTGDISPAELAHLQRKIAAAGEMKTAIKKFIDWWDWQSDDDSTTRGVMLASSLRATMEAYLNCDASALPDTT